MNRCRIHLVAGARPNVMKIAPLYAALKEQSWCDPKVVFVTQHFSRNMSDDLFAEFGVREGVTVMPVQASDDYGSRLGEIVSAYTALLNEDAPDMVVVPGDVDVALATSLAARRSNRMLVHLEAGLRSYDPTMPEEMNRILVDSIADVLLAPSEAAAQNLLYHEGASHDRVFFVGNIMIDALKSVLSEERALKIRRELDLGETYAVATFHRPANVDDPRRLRRIVDLLLEVAAETPVVFPVHPRTAARLQDAGLDVGALTEGRIRTSEPLGYTDFANLISKASYVLTDSGGIQEEATWLDVPCFTLRDSTERPITVTAGTNTLVDFEDAAPQIRVRSQERSRRAQLPLWDGHTAWRVAQVLRTKWKAIQGPVVGPVT